jgi:hypothetical protein
MGVFWATVVEVTAAVAAAVPVLAAVGLAAVDTVAVVVPWAATEYRVAWFAGEPGKVAAKEAWV